MVTITKCLRFMVLTKGLWSVYDERLFSLSILEAPLCDRLSCFGPVKKQCLMGDVCGRAKPLTARKQREGR